MATGKQYPTSAHEQLAVFAGNWKTTGQTTDGIKVEATDKYEWLPGRYFLLHTWDAHIGNDRSRGIEILGMDADRHSLQSRFYDDQGQSDSYRITNEGNTWKFTRSNERSTVEVSEDGNTLTVLWEMSENGVDWKHWMNVTLQKT